MPPQKEATEPVVADKTQIGVPIDSPDADPEAAAAKRGVRRDSAGRELYPWEVSGTDHVGPAGLEARREKRKPRD